MELPSLPALNVNLAASDFLERVGLPLKIINLQHILLDRLKAKDELDIYSSLLILLKLIYGLNDKSSFFWNT